MENAGFRKNYQMTGNASASGNVGSGSRDAGPSGVGKNVYNKTITVPKGGSANVKESK